MVKWYVFWYTLRDKFQTLEWPEASVVAAVLTA